MKASWAWLGLQKMCIMLLLFFQLSYALLQIKMSLLWLSVSSSLCHKSLYQVFFYIFCDCESSHIDIATICLWCTRNIVTVKWYTRVNMLLFVRKYIVLWLYSLKPFSRVVIEKHSSLAALNYSVWIALFWKKMLVLSLIWYFYLFSLAVEKIGLSSL